MTDNEAGSGRVRKGFKQFGGQLREECGSSEPTSKMVHVSTFVPGIQGMSLT